MLINLGWYHYNLWGPAVRVIAEAGILPQRAQSMACFAAEGHPIGRNESEFVSGADRWTGERFQVHYNAIHRTATIRRMRETA